MGMGARIAFFMPVGDHGNGGQARLLYAGRGSYGIVKGTYLSKGQSNIDFSFKNQIEN